MEITSELTELCLKQTLSGVTHETVGRVVGTALAHGMPQDEICKMLKADNGLAMLGFMNITYSTEQFSKQQNELAKQQEALINTLGAECMPTQCVAPNSNRKRLPKWMQRH